MFVVEVVAALTTVLFVRDLVDRRRRPRLLRPDHPLALVHGALRQLRRGGRRGPRQGAGRQPAAHPHRDAWPSASTARRARPTRRCPAPRLKVGDVVLVEAGDLIPSDGEVIEGVASVNEAAITGESAPVIRESGGDRSAVTGGTQVLSDWIRVRITAARRLDLPRPHDRAGRGRLAPEDAERDRAQHPARRPDPHLRLRGRLDPELRRLCRRRDPGHRAGRAVRHADPDHHRRAALGHRHRRHGPAGALQRARHVGPRRRGGGRRRHAAPRQDRHHHARQPPGDRVPAGRAASPSRSWPTRRSSPRSPTRRRRAARSWCSPRRSTASAPATWRASTPPSCRSPPRPA